VFASRETAEMLFPVGPFTHFTAAHTAWEFALDPAGITHGWNTVMVTNNSKIPVKIVSVEIGVNGAERPA
jgi:hypothetical protein